MDERTRLYIPAWIDSSSVVQVSVAEPEVCGNPHDTTQPPDLWIGLDYHDLSYWEQQPLLPKWRIARGKSLWGKSLIKNPIHFWRSWTIKKIPWNPMKSWKILIKFQISYALRSRLPLGDLFEGNNVRNLDDPIGGFRLVSCILCRRWNHFIHSNLIFERTVKCITRDDAE